MHIREARLYSRIGENLVQCEVCERRCRIPLGAKGICGSYTNYGGKLVHLGYGKLSAIESRPIEIKPLFHYWPNSTALTFSSWGCNFYCPWCQNHHLSFRHPKEDDAVYAPQDLINLIAETGDEGFSASFNEPTVNFDFVLDLAEFAKSKGFYSMVVTNGYQTTKAIEALVGADVDGWSIDIKGCPKMKRALVNIDHEIVFRNAKRVLDLGGHVEMVYLVVTNTNDFDECVEWIIDKHLSYLGPETPLHVNRYFPAFKWSEPATPIGRLLQIAEKAKKSGIEYVYVGNLHDPRLESTYCPKCGKLLIYRNGYRVKYFNLDKDGGKYRCPRCGREIPIRGSYIPWK